MSAHILVFPSCRGRCVAKQKKNARELVALIKRDLKTRHVSLEVFGHRYDGWYATALSGRLRALSVQPDVERVVERLRTLYDLKR
jgi:chromosome segregation and condensation protein ScpB